MGQEIERKFRIQCQKVPRGEGIPIKQGYLPSAGVCEVRVRVAGDKAFLTLKSKNEGTTRREFEYPLPVSDAKQILSAFCATFVEKIRYKVEHGGHTWDVDIFQGDNEGLALAEIELQCETETFQKPGWVDEEVTGDIRFYNAHLAAHPFKQWQEK